jgi:hypothetical protein
MSGEDEERKIAYKSFINLLFCPFRETFKSEKPIKKCALRRCHVGNVEGGNVRVYNHYIFALLGD